MFPFCAGGAEEKGSCFGGGGFARGTAWFLTARPNMMSAIDAYCLIGKWALDVEVVEVVEERGPDAFQ